GPVGAFFLLTLNYARLGKRGLAWMTVVFGLLTIAGVMAISIALPDSFPGCFLGVPLAFILWATAKTLQGNAYDVHLSKGGAPASGWAAVGFAVLGLALYLGVFLIVFVSYEHFLGGPFGKSIDFGGGEEVYYTKGATEADARALGAFLREAGFFNGQGPKSVQ